MTSVISNFKYNTLVWPLFVVFLLSNGILSGLPAIWGGISGSLQSKVKYEDGTLDRKDSLLHRPYVLAVMFTFQLSLNFGCTHSFLSLYYDIASSTVSSPLSATQCFFFQSQCLQLMYHRWIWINNSQCTGRNSDFFYFNKELRCKIVRKRFKTRKYINMYIYI
jgi:hypothetical protein